jgi:hypothetical protein
MEIVLIGLVILAGAALIYFNRSKGLDVNSDGKVDVKDASAAVTNTVEGVKAAADVNNDGKVSTADVAVAAETVVKKTRAAVKKTVAKPKAAAATAAKKPGRKPKTAK